MKKSSSEWLQAPAPEASGKGIVAFRDHLLQQGYRHQEFVRMAGLDYRSWIPNWQMDAALLTFKNQEAESPLVLLFQVFLLNKAVSPENLKPVLGAASFEYALAAGLLISSSPGLLYCPFSLFEIEGLLVLTDPLLQGLLAQFFQNSIMPLYPESYELSDMTFRALADRVLDLGTGSGVHALLASRHANTVTAIDLNPRALAFTHFNSSLNDLKGITVLKMDMAEMDGLGKYDLILSNPPYIPFVDAEGPMLAAAGTDGEFFIRLILGHLDRLLTAGGICLLVHLLCDLPDSEGVDRLRSYLPDGGKGDFACSFSTRKAHETGLDPAVFRNIRYAFTQVHHTALKQDPHRLKQLEAHHQAAANALDLTIQSP